MRTTANRYMYAGDNPINYIDPLGEDFWDFLESAGNWIGAALGCVNAVSLAFEYGLIYAGGAIGGGLPGTVTVGVISCAAGAVAGYFNAEYVTP